MPSPAAPPKAAVRVRRTVVRWLLILAGTYAAICVVMMFFENALVYHPAPASAYWLAPPSPDVRDVVLTSADGAQIHGWWLPCPGATGALLYLHGNAGNLSARGDSIVRLRETLRLPVLIIDYPGFGKSSGTPSEAGCYAAADAAYDWLTREQKIAPAEIVLFGKSLGGGVATHLASRKEHRALVLAKTYTSLPDVGAYIYPFLPARLLMRNRFDSLSRIADCRRPIFVAHGTADELIPFALGKRLYEAANEPKQFLDMPGIGHNDPFPDEFYDALRDFLDSHAAEVH
jgi:fermentation-respiration switch protein FrsA (DUF1100 family)